jgi:C-terminal processing protease CtpA/Prc
MRSFSIVILFLVSFTSFSAQSISETQKLVSLCKVWGFLKYYHPNVAKGNVDWDKQLIQKINELEKINDRNQLNDLYSHWIDSLGNVGECAKCTVAEPKTEFLKNFDMSWSDNEILFTKEISQKLHYIQNNGNIDDPYYFGRSERKVFFRNENSYSSKFTSQSISLLELFRYWNMVEYFYPYKYKTDENWNDVLTEMIPKFLGSTDDENYQLTLAELVTKIDDSHAFLFSPLISLNQYGRRKIPVEYSYAEGKLVITKINGIQYKEEIPLKVGDVIYTVDGNTIPQMVNRFGKYIPASNSWGKIKKVKSLFLFSNKDSLEVRLERDGQNISIKAKTYLLRDIINDRKTVPEKWKFLDPEKKIGYVNMGIIEIKDLEEMFSALKSAGSIIFDLRNYPKQTIIPLSRLILPENTIYYQFNFPDTDHPGKFYSRKNSIGRKNPDYYKGNVVILADENTQSQAETTTMMLKQHPNSKVIGSNTSGANGDVITFNIAGLKTSFTGIGAYYPDGRETQRIGIIPDIYIQPTVKGLKEGKDEVLERALEYIKTGN